MTKETMAKKVKAYTGMDDYSVYPALINAIDFIWSLILDGRPEGICEHCSETFPMTRKDQKFCKRECKGAAHNQIRKTRDAGKDYQE